MNLQSLITYDIHKKIFYQDYESWLYNDNQGYSVSHIKVHKVLVVWEELAKGQ